MTDKPYCERCRRIQAAIDHGIPPYEAREANGWDECSEDDCPMLPRPYSFKTYPALRDIRLTKTRAPLNGEVPL
jgi:hypothetical protein